MAYKFTTKQTEKSARAVSLNLPISTKHSVEVCRAVRGMQLENAKQFLEAVVAKKRAVPFKRYNSDVGHKRGMAAGRYPIKACGYILRTLESAESNAADKGLLSDSLFVASIVPQQASRPMRYGRHRGRKTHRTHIEVTLEEREIEAKAKKTEAKSQKQAEKAEPKKEDKKETAQAEQPKSAAPKTQSQPEAEKAEPKTESKQEAKPAAAKPKAKKQAPKQQPKQKTATKKPTKAKK